jgi:hypothetical protein
MKEADHSALVFRAEDLTVLGCRGEKGSVQKPSFRARSARNLLSLMGGLRSKADSSLRSE